MRLNFKTTWDVCDLKRILIMRGLKWDQKQSTIKSLEIEFEKKDTQVNIVLHFTAYLQTNSC